MRAHRRKRAPLGDIAGDARRSATSPETRAAQRQWLGAERFGLPSADHADQVIASFVHQVAIFARCIHSSATCQVGQREYETAEERPRKHRLPEAAGTRVARHNRRAAAQLLDCERMV